MHQLLDLRWWRILLTIKYRRHRERNRSTAAALKATGDPRPEWLILYSLWMDDIAQELAEERKRHGGFG